MTAPTYEHRRVHATRRDLWPLFVAPPLPLGCPGGDECDCHDRGDEDD